MPRKQQQQEQQNQRVQEEALEALSRAFFSLLRWEMLRGNGAIFVAPVRCRRQADLLFGCLSQSREQDVGGSDEYLVSGFKNNTYVYINYTFKKSTFDPELTAVFLFTLSSS